MTTQELYELLSKQIAEMDARFTRRFEKLDSRLETLNSRLRNVEINAAGSKGRKAGWAAAQNWITISISFVALGISIAVALWK